VALTAEFIKVSDRRKEQSALDAAAFEEAIRAATIGGNNFFSGELPGKADASFGTVASDESTWQAFWGMSGRSAPGPLPRGVKAIMHSEDSREEPRTLRPTEVFVDDRGCNVEWQRLYLDHQPGATSCFAVLLVPDCEIGRQRYSDAFMSSILRKEREFREDIDRCATQIAGGAQAPVRAVPRVRFRAPS